MLDFLCVGAATKDVFLITKGLKMIQSNVFSTGYGECFAYGSKVEVESLITATGGGATNAAYTYKNFGFESGVYTHVGADDEGERIIKNLKEKNIDITTVKVSKKYKSAYATILVGPDGDRTILVYRGAASHFDDSPKDIAKVQARWFHVSSLAGNSVVLKSFIHRAQKIGAGISWLPGKAELELGLRKLQPLLQNIDVVIMNREEAAFLTKKNPSNIGTMLREIQKYSAGRIVITAARDGAYTLYQGSILQTIAPKVKVINTTGAGDAFASAFVGALCKGKDIQRALQVATLNAAGVLTHMGAKDGLLRTFPKESEYQKISQKLLSV